MRVRARRMGRRAVGAVVLAAAGYVVSRWFSGRLLDADDLLAEQETNRPRA